MFRKALSQAKGFDVSNGLYPPDALGEVIIKEIPGGVAEARDQG